jgi:hypothetical protein
VSLKSNPGVAIRVWWLPPINKLPLDASHPLIKAVARANSWMEKLLSEQVASLEGYIAPKQLVFKNTRLYGPDHLAECIGYGALQPDVIFHWNHVRVILPEPRQHTGVHLSVEVIHQNEQKIAISWSRAS